MLRITWIGLFLGLLAGCSASRRGHRDAPAVIAPAPPAPVAPGFAPGAPAPGAPAPAFPGAPQQFPAAPPPGAAQFPAAPPGPSTAFPTVPPQGNGIPNAPPGPSGALPMAPSGPNPQFPTAQPPGPSAASPTAPPPAASGTPGPMGQIESNWQPAEAREPALADKRVLLGPPDVSAEQSGKDKQLYPPQVDAGSTDKNPSASLPVGIPQFAAVKQQIATGRRPLDDGYEWLKNSRYRTVLHVRLPGENDDTDRKQAEDRGLTYVSLELSPVLLAKDTVEEFFKIVRDPKRQPTFVYDRDGSLAGGLWYLYFRIAEQDSDEVARIRARAAGLREDREGAHREMWQSAQKYVADNP